MNFLNKVLRSERLEGKVEEGILRALALSDWLSAFQFLQYFSCNPIGPRQTFSAIRLAVILDHVPITVINEHHVPLLSIPLRMCIHHLNQRESTKINEESSFSFGSQTAPRWVEVGLEGNLDVFSQPH